MGLVSAITSCTLRTPDLQVLELAAELFDRIVYPDIMGLQKSVELIKGCNAQKAAQSGLADVSALYSSRANASSARRDRSPAVALS